MATKTPLRIEDLQPGQRLGRHRLEHELGRGAAGIVFLAEDTLLKQQVCLKVLHPGLLQHPEALERFAREIVLARRISHKGICRLHDLHEDEGLRYITMEFVDGVPLRAMLGTSQALLPLDRSLRITQHILEALQAAHGEGVIHRDLKPRNIMLRKDDDISILDFGVATATDVVSELTKPGVALGTMNYIAPEVWQGGPASPRSDLFAVGVILYNLLTGAMPWRASTPLQLFDQMSQRPAPAPSGLRRGVPPSVDWLISRSLAVDPALRFADASEFAAACAAAAADVGVGASLRRVPLDTSDPFAPRPGTIADAGRSDVSDALRSDAAGFDQAGERTVPEQPQFKPGASGSGGGARIGAMDAAQPHEASASYVVAGKAVDLPVRAKGTDVDGNQQPRVISLSDASAAVSGEHALHAPPAEQGMSPAMRVVVALSVVAVLVVGAATALILWPAPGGPIKPGDADAGLLAVAPASVDAGAIDAGAIDAGAIDAGAIDAGAPVQAAGADAGASSGAIVDGGAAAGAVVVDAGVQDAAPAPPPRPTIRVAGRPGFLAALPILNRALDDKGLVRGDDEQLDVLLADMTKQSRLARFDTATRTLIAALERVDAIAIDKAFVQAKFNRMQTSFNLVKKADLRSRLDDVRRKAIVALEGGDLAAANAALNEAFRMIAKGK